jgi:alpha-ribazole phosphatase
MKTIAFIRHGMTQGNLEKRYIGRTDQPLCEKGTSQAQALFSNGLPACGSVFASPYLRCLQTAHILFPDQQFEILEELRECDFGDFEGKTAEELEQDASYTAWLTEKCATPIPGGEGVMEFKERCCAAFEQAASALPDDATAAFVIHGGTIMAILERYAQPARQFYEYHIGNCELILCDYDDSILTVRGTAL